MKHTLYSLRVPDGIAALIRQMHPLLKKKVEAGLATVIADPLSGKALKEELDGLRSFRVSKIRIICRIVDRTVEIVTIGPRSTFYKETYRFLTKSK